MSGIVAILHTDGAPIDRPLLRAMTEYMAFRGPDAQEIWCEGAIGFGHAMLRTTFEAERESQPCSLDGQVWIAADCRVDGRADLIRELKARGREAELATPDPVLILHAYHAWGEECVRHLIGDFAFAIWDGRQRRLFCARDHFGVKPLFYAHVGETLIVSNTLNCIRQHPHVSDELNELAIADFLLFGGNQVPETTTFADIQRVPAAHTLTWQEGEREARRSRYWTLPIDGCIRYNRTEEYVEHFKCLFWQAVGDRLRTDRVGVFMSGGLDSTSIAAVAKDHFNDSKGRNELRAYTQTYEVLIPSPEGGFARLAADHIGIPITFQSADRFRLFAGQIAGTFATPEPIDDCLADFSRKIYQMSAQHGRVALSGEGGDAIFRPKSLYFMRLLKELQWPRFVGEMRNYMREVGRRPCLGPRGLLRRYQQRHEYLATFPDGLNPDFVARWNLQERWSASDPPQAVHPTRPEAYALTAGPEWSQFFENENPGVTRQPVEVRYPILDGRLVEFLLALPDSYLFVDKGLLRIIMKGHLPEPVRLRAKMALGTLANPINERIKRGDGQILASAAESPEMERFARRPGPDEPWQERQSKYWSLNFWLSARNATALPVASC